MSLPELLAATVGDEDVVAEVPLGGDDRLAVTPTRTLVFRGDGLLSDESVDEYGHDVERIDVSTGRRKAKITLGYGLDGDETLSVPAKRVDDVLHPVLAGVLSASGVTGPGETVVRTFRFSELTLIVTSERLVKHVGSAVWDADFEEFHYEDITGLDFEEGTVATAVVLVHDGRSERFKAPNESARAVRETLADAVCSFHGVDSLEEFRVAAAEAEEPAADAEPSGTTDFGEGPDPLSASPAADAEADAEGPEPGDATGGAGRSTETDPGSGDDGADSAEAAASASAGSASGDDPLDADPLAADAGVDDAATDPLAADATEPASTAEGIDSEAAGESASAVGAEGRSADAAGAESAGGDPVGDADAVAAETDAEGPVRGDDAFDGSPFESAGVEDADLASEVAALRRTVEAQSERLDRQSALIEQLIEELRRGR
ncbi:hypothetical protein DVK05_07655 [Halorubrum sp. Atlit-8R]|uniref:DUF7115 domain-containing protein n=1 Tax=unclassified Halorubrum TaxID=2642239 RepID=UPI000EF1FAE1|nr:MULTISPECIES: hypothetical protein [unclassified Halorubrum]RLM63263.1 hypothetical protein DVK08_17905 [Halorubrum sp. Atlit-9R]RLM81921.1 hypothetical protein DVK05_07655 [Halorubrum sp. Atlit-8R]